MKKKLLLPMAAALLLLFADSQEKLRLINRQIEEVQARLQASKRDKSSILNDIYALELQAETTVIELNRVNLLVGDARSRITRKQREEEALRGRIRDSLENVRRILRVLYKMGELGYVKLFVNIGSLDQLFRNYRLIVSLMDDKIMEIRTIRRDILKLQKVQAEMQAELGRLDGLKNEKSGKLARLRGLRQEKLEMIARINRERDLNSRLLDELKAESENLTRFLDQRSAVPVPEAVDLGPMRGRLAWPLRGTVISSFGKKKSARFDTYTMNNGIEIKPERSDEIRAVGGGEVLFCDYFKGYGNLIILQHAGNFHTLYGHCDRFLKNPGDRVATGEVIALAGNSGSLYGKALYFEIRRDLKPMDPLPWLAKK
ncbi:MAG: peptidoglycan DD-metalloendopeptidase family protein [Candidatus Aminicenantes bacterium]|nr:peptidoglycan DD-metalloendopeptidase family protein [Candidatus Aminicenantes bacterium]